MYHAPSRGRKDSRIDTRREDRYSGVCQYWPQDRARGWAPLLVGLIFQAAPLEIYALYVPHLVTARHLARGRKCEEGESRVREGGTQERKGIKQEEREKGRATPECSSWARKEIETRAAILTQAARVKLFVRFVCKLFLKITRESRSARVSTRDCLFRNATSLLWIWARIKDSSALHIWIRSKTKEGFSSNRSNVWCLQYRFKKIGSKKWLRIVNKHQLRAC